MKAETNIAVLIIAAGWLWAALAAFGSEAVAPTTRPTTRPTTQPAIEPRADELFRAACQRLADARSFTVSAEVWQDRVLGDWKVQASRTVDLWVRRPDKCHAEVRSAARDRDIWYDGRTITVLNPGKGLYGTVEAPATIDKAIDFAVDRYGIEMPLADLIVSDPYASATRNVEVGRYMGPGIVDGMRCHHLAFSQEKIDWQVWIEDGPQPLIRKLVITYKDEPQSPQFIAVLREWNLGAAIDDSVFAFCPPVGAVRVAVAESGDERGVQPVKATDLPHGQVTQPDNTGNKGQSGPKE